MYKTDSIYWLSLIWKSDSNTSLARIAKNKLASRIKLADLRDNANLSRLPGITEKDIGCAKKYRRAIRFLKTNSH